MRKHWKASAILALVVAYLSVGTYGWLGVREVERRNPDGTYWAAIYSHSSVFVPFMETHDVLVPSNGDLNSHTVFETYGFWQKVDIRWIDNHNLQVICHRCNQTKLSINKIDSIDVHLINQ
jgi:hypothetical protein